MARFRPCFQALSLFALFSALPPKAHAFTNPGFENGSLSGWTVSSLSGAGVVYAPHAVTVSPGAAPHTQGTICVAPAICLDRVHSGAFAAELDSGRGDNNHGDVIRIEQSDTVPGTGCLSFWFAAVLSGHHQLNGESYGSDAYVQVDMIIGGATVASQRYSWFDNAGMLVDDGADPYGAPEPVSTNPPMQWKHLPWTRFYFNLSSYAGRTVTLRFSALSCDASGHNAWGYVDDVEWGACPTSTVTPTPTFTLSPTITPSFSATPTFTLTRSDTPSFTPSSSATPSYSVTATPSSTDTPTRTATLTSSPTATLTRSDTPTFTLTPSFTPSSSATPSYSVTATPSSTDTPTRTATLTSSPTATLTRSDTPTFTLTLTFTPSSSATPSYSVTATPSSTDTPTLSATLTASPTSTFTRTMTPTFSHTPTATPSQTSTLSFTQTYTLTATLTATPSPTDTPSFTATPSATATRTATPSPSPTPTATSTPTDTPTSTWTPTDTPTSTFTRSSTRTSSPTPSSTSTDSPTLTHTRTSSPTSTSTPTYTATPTFSDSPTSTDTPTITMTFTPYIPNVMVTLKIYNSAGEVVAVILDRLSTDQRPRGLQAASGALVPDLPGALARLNLVGTYGLDLSWNGRNSAGQMVQSGSYAAMAEVTDPYGKVSTFSAGISVLRQPVTLQASIYNSAGELVRLLQSPAGEVPLITDMVLSGKELLLGADRKLELRRRDGTTWLSWDGRNGQGRLVDSGMYLLKLEAIQPGTTTAIMTESIEVLREPSANPLQGAIAAPNPAGPGASRVVILLPRGEASPEVTAEFFDVAGEKVAEADNRGHAGRLIWDIRTRKFAAGIYFAVLKLRDASAQPRKLKLALAN